MAGTTIEIGAELMGRLFPFYILVNRNLEVVSCGETVHRMFEIEVGCRIHTFFDVIPADIIVSRIEDMGGKSYQLVTSAGKNEENPMLIQGELEYLPSCDQLLFLGTPSKNSNVSTAHNSGLNGSFDELFSVVARLPTKEAENTDIPESDRVFLLSDTIKGAVITNAEGAIQWICRDFEQSIGYKLHEIVGKRPRDVIYGKRSTHIPSSYVDGMVKKKKPFSFDNIGYNRNSRSFWFRTTVQPILDDQNNVKGRYYFFEDVSELKTNEYALRESQELWKFAFEGAGDGVWYYDIQNELFQVSYKFKELLGYKSWDVLTLAELRQCMLAEDYVHFIENLLPSLTRTDPSFSQENKMYKKDGTSNYFKTRGKVVKWTQDGKIGTIFGTLTDINEDKLKDLELRKISARLATILGSLNNAVLLENEQRRIVLANQKFCDMFSVPVSSGELLGIDCLELANSSRYLFADPASFSNRVDYLLACKEMVLGDIVYLQDGRILERDYIPVFIDELYTGHLWKYSDVTASKNLELQLKNSEARLSALINNFNTAVLFEDTSRNIIFANKALYNILDESLSSVSLVGSNSITSLEFVKHLFKYPDEEVTRINRIVADRSIVAAKYLEMADGRILKQQFIPVVVDNEDSGFLWIYEDVTDRTNYERKIIEQREYFHRILNELPADVLILNLDQKFDFINKNAVKSDEMRSWIIGKNMYEYCERKGIDKSRAVQRDLMFRAVVTNKKMQSNVDTHVLQDGSHQYMLRFLYPFLSGKDEVEFVVGFGIDITEQIRNEMEIAEQRAYYHEILNEVPADIIIFSIDHKYQFINKNAVKDPEIRQWLIGKSDYDYCDNLGIPRDIAQEKRRNFEQVLSYKKPVSFIDDVREKDKSVSHILRIIYPFLKANGDVKFVISYGIDVTQQIQNKRRAETQEKVVLNLLQLVKDGVFSCTAEGTTNFYNDSFARILGIEGKTALHSVNFFAMLSASDQDNFLKSIEKLDFTGQEQSFILRILKGDGKEQYLDFTIDSAVNKINGPYIGRITDITEVVNKELYLNQIIAKEKELNNTKSQFIRITSHELRTPLAIIQANAEILEMMNSGTLENHGNLKPAVMTGRIVKEVRLMTEILNELMMVSRIEAGKIDFAVTEVDILAFVQAIKEDLYEPHTDGRILTIKSASDQPLMGSIDQKLMRHAIVNLVNNAFKYSSGKKSPEVVLTKTDNSIIFEVVDYGIGIPKHDHRKLFSAFFRSSNVATIPGSGLGLMVVDYVVKKHNGTVSFTSSENQGSIFKITIPFS